MPNPTIHSAFGYAAQVVVADRETGAIEKVVAVHDVGRAVNPLLCEGQIEGSVHMGLGYALTEDFPADELGVPDQHDAAQPRHHPPQGRAADRGRAGRGAPAASAYGIKGVGEIGLVPTAGAVAAALHKVDGEWRIGAADASRRVEPTATSSGSSVSE